MPESAPAGGRGIPRVPGGGLEGEGVDVPVEGGRRVRRWGVELTRQLRSAHAPPRPGGNSTCMNSLHVKPASRRSKGQPVRAFLRSFAATHSRRVAGEHGLEVGGAGRACLVPSGEVCGLIPCPAGPVYPAADETGPQRQPTEEHREHGSDGERTRPEQQPQETDPQHLVDQRRGARQDERLQRAEPPQPWRRAAAQRRRLGGSRGRPEVVRGGNAFVRQRHPMQPDHRQHSGALRLAQELAPSGPNEPPNQPPAAPTEVRHDQPRASPRSDQPSGA